MSTIKELAKLMVQNIKHKQNIFTHQSRKKALKEFERFLYTPKTTDDEIIFAAMQKRDWVNEFGRFGIRGHSGSNVLKQMDQFIQQGLYLIQNKDDLSRTPIKKLADLVLEDIKKAQNNRTDASRKTAVTNLALEFNKPDVTDEELIDAAEQQKNEVLQNGKFGFWGHAGSNFLNKINSFIQQTTHLKTVSSAKETEKKKQRTNILTPSLLVEMQRKAWEFQNKKPRYAPSIFELKDKKHTFLEEGIKRLFETHFGKTSRISRAWRFRIDKTVTGETALNNKLFFEQFTHELNNQAKLPVELREKLNAYFELIEDKDFVQKKENIFTSNETQTHKDIFNILHEKSLKENVEEPPKIKNPLFQNSQYSIWKSSEEYKIDQETVRGEMREDLTRLTNP